MVVHRFVGEICGFGTTSGVRVVVGRWTTSPFGLFADAMVEHADGHRVLVAPTAAVAELVGAVYEFDDIVVHKVLTERRTGSMVVAAGPLTAEVTIGSRDALGWLLRSVPRPLATSSAWATVLDPVVRVTMRGVRTKGRTAGGREYYGATDRHRLLAVRASWDGVDLGALAAVDPPVRFGFSSAPRSPSIVAVCTTIRPRI